MKKLILIFVAVLMFASTVFASHLNWYSLVGKRVKIETSFGNVYIGRVSNVAEYEICRQYDPLTHTCIWKEVYYTMFLRMERNTKVISCETISSIEEIND